MIDRAYLVEQRAELEKQREELIVQLHQIEGAARMLDYLIAKIDAPPPPTPEASAE